MDELSDIRSEASGASNNYQTKSKRTPCRYRSNKHTLGSYQQKAAHAFSQSLSGFIGETAANQSASSGGSETGDNRDKDSGESESEWSEADLPTPKALTDVVATAQGPFVVGSDGNVLTRTNGKWRFVIEAGPAAKRNRLTAAAVTGDGKRVWFAGASGALGYYDLETEQKHDYSAPQGKTSTWEGIAVTGAAGSETLRVANGSGEVLPATTGDDGCPQWGDVTKPAGGSTIAAIEYGDGTCYAVDTSGNALVEVNDGWEDIGVENAQVNFFDVAAVAETVLIAGGDGLLYRYDRSCENWTPVRVGSESLHAVAHGPETTLAVGASGAIYERTSQARWARLASPIEDDLAAVALGDPSVAVGSSGTVIERKSNQAETWQTLLRLAGGIILMLTTAALAYTGTVSMHAALAVIIGVAAALGLYERGLRTSSS